MEQEIQPRGMVCPRCGQYDFVFTGTIETAWGRQNSRECQHHAWGSDVYYVRSVIETYQCRNCTYTETFTNSEGEWRCEGYDKPPIN